MCVCRVMRTANSIFLRFKKYELDRFCEYAIKSYYGVQFRSMINKK